MILMWWNWIEERKLAGRSLVQEFKNFIQSYDRQTKLEEFEDS